MLYPLTLARRRAGVVIHYLCLLLFAITFCLGEYWRWNTYVVLIAVAFLIQMALSFHFTLIRTGFWRLTHTGIEMLDEREIQLTHSAMRRSYAIFSALSLAIIVFMTLSVRFSFFTLTHRGHYSFGLIVVICLLYLIQTLPGSIIAWKERSIPAD
jgi:hypothetical protein